MEESEKKKTVRIKSRKTTRSEAKEHNLAVASSPQASFDYAILRASDIGCGRRVPSPSLFLHAMTIITSKPIKGIMLLTSYHHHHYHHRVIIVMVEDQETSKKRKTTITRRRGARAETCQGLEEEEQKTTWKYEHRPGRLVMASYPKAEPDKNGPHVRPPPPPALLAIRDRPLSGKKLTPITQSFRSGPWSLFPARMPRGPIRANMEQQNNARIALFGGGSIPLRSYEAGRVETGRRSWLALAPCSPAHRVIGGH